MQSKSFQPSLIDIPEDDYSLRTSGATSVASNSRVSSKTIKEEPKNEDPLYSEFVTNTSKSSSLDQIYDQANKPNTLKRLAQRVNTHGQTLVSELKRSLDIKPKLPDAYFNPYPIPNATSDAVSIPQLVKKEKIYATEPTFPELIKPSMLRNAMKRDKAVENVASTFENFRQEMLVTLNKVRTVSPLSSLTRSKSNAQNYQSQLSEGDNKVHKWLQTLDEKSIHSLSKYNGEKNAAIIGKPKLPIRSMSFCHSKKLSPESILNNPSEAYDKKSSHYLHNKNSNFINKDKLSSDTALTCQKSLDETSYVKDVKSENNINDFLNFYESKIFFSRFNNLTDAEQSHTSLLNETNVNTNGTGIYGNPFLNEQENSYEEIHFGSMKSHVPSLLAAQQSIDRTIFALKKEAVDDEGHCSIYSNPESLISEIHISGDKPIGKQSPDNRLSIELTDDTLSSDENELQRKSISSSRRKKKKVKRNDSIIQDSLERPKIKKKLSNAEKKEIQANNDRLLNEEDEHGKVKRSKTLRTFRDYHLMNFSKKNPIGNQLSLVNEGIRFNFKGPAAPLKTNDYKPPLPPKGNKIYDDSETSLENLHGSATSSAPYIPPKHKLRHSMSLASDLHRKKTFSMMSENAVPTLPPKLKPKYSFSERSNGQCYNMNREPPKLPIKYRKRSSDISMNSHSNSRDSIPEVSENEERAFLHNILSNKKNSGENFLVDGSIVNNINISLASNVPMLQANETAETIDNNEKQATRENNKSNEKEKVTSGLGKLHRSQSMSQLSENNYVAKSSQHVRGQFILSNNGPLTLQRQRSFTNGSNLIHQLRKITTNLEDVNNEEYDGPLVQIIKGELEKHFQEKSGADSVKRTWRKVIEKVDSHKKLSLNELQKYIADLEKKSFEHKFGRQDDSGYHSSTDSSDSSRLRKTRLTETVKQNLLKSNLRRTDTIAASTDLIRRTAGLFDKPVQK